MFESVENMVLEYKNIQEQLLDPKIHEYVGRAKKLNRRFAELTIIVEMYEKWKNLVSTYEIAQELVHESNDFIQEAKELKTQISSIEKQLRNLLISHDPNDSRDIILEIKAGSGGDEAALFVGDMLRAYSKYAESKKWKVEIISINESNLEYAYKDVQLSIKRKSESADKGVWGYLKFEGGVHRVQRVPATETKGRIHTSAVGVMVFPEVDEPQEIVINNSDLKIDVYRSSGPGGQSVNTTDSAVRITHLPTNIVVSMQNEKSQIQNKEAAMRVLRARLLSIRQEKIEAEKSEASRSQVRSMDRSERIRTYNFPENRITDHRTGYKAYNLDQVMNGYFNEVIQSCIEMDENSRLKIIGEKA